MRCVVFADGVELRFTEGRAVGEWAATIVTGWDGRGFKFGRWIVVPGSSCIVCEVFQLSDLLSLCSLLSLSLYAFLHRIPYLRFPHPQLLLSFSISHPLQTHQTLSTYTTSSSSHHHPHPSSPPQCPPATRTSSPHHAFSPSTQRHNSIIPYTCILPWRIAPPRASMTALDIVL